MSRKFYEVYLDVGNTHVATVLFKSITQVAKFLETVNFDIIKVSIYTSKGSWLDPFDILEVLHA